MKRILLASSLLLASATNFAAEKENENIETYDNCLVWEAVDALTDERDIYLRCINEAGDFDFEEDAYFTIATSTKRDSKGGWIQFKPGDFIFHIESTIKVKWRFDKEEMQEGTYTYSSEHMSASASVTESYLKQILKWLSESDKLVMDLGGEASKTLNLKGSKKAVEDFKERVEKLKPSDKGEEESEKEENEE